MLYVFSGIIGTKFYGKDETGQPPGTYIATQWAVLFFIPILPLGSFRIQPQEPSTAAISPFSQRDVIERVPWQWQHIVNVYAFIAAIAILIPLTYRYRRILTGQPAPVPPIASVPDETSPPKPAYKRPTTDANGIPFPETSGFMAGYAQAFTNGAPELIVDNTGSDQDIYVKLYNLDVAPPGVASVFFIKGQDQFTVETITPGNYELRYSVLDTGDFFRTSLFTLEETLDVDRNMLTYTRLTLMLAGIVGGDMKTYPITAEDFAENTAPPEGNTEAPTNRQKPAEPRQPSKPIEGEQLI